MLYLYIYIYLHTNSSQLPSVSLSKHREEMWLRTAAEGLNFFSLLTYTTSSAAVKPKHHEV